MRAARSAFLDFFQTEGAGGRLGFVLFRFFLLFAQILHVVHGLDQQEHNECNNQEVDNGGNERAEVNGSARNNQRACGINAAARDKRD